MTPERLAAILLRAEHLYQQLPNPSALDVEIAVQHISMLVAEVERLEARVAAFVVAALGLLSRSRELADDWKYEEHGDGYDAWEMRLRELVAEVGRLRGEQKPAPNKAFEMNVWISPDGRFFDQHHTTGWRKIRVREVTE